MSSLRQSSALAAAAAATFLGMLVTGAQGATQTFSSPGYHPFQVPAGVTSMYVLAVGARGGTCNYSGGLGASVAAIVPVSAGQQLVVGVGGVGRCGSGGPGAAGGGGAAGAGLFSAAGGGGASLIGSGAPDFNRLLVVAGGGGGSSSGWPGGNAGSNGGSQLGGLGAGGAGTQAAGGEGGTRSIGDAVTAGSDGTALTGGVGGNGVSGAVNPGNDAGGGGGGGGYYGGGGGAGADFPGSGGGGSSFVTPASTYVMPPGASANASRVTLIYPPPLFPTIASPASGGVYAAGQSVATRFTCPTAPVSCDDSTGTSTTSGGTGRLDTSKIGMNTYTVTSTAADGIILTSSINYGVAGSPSASISPAFWGQTYQQGQFVQTEFSCQDGEGGPGLSSCADSAGFRDGRGKLDTSSPGPRTYTVTAASKNGLTHTASISYAVAVSLARPAPALPPVMPSPPPIQATTPLPAVERLKIEPSSFVAAASGPVSSPVGSSRVGARVSYSLNVAGTVTFTVQRRKAKRYVTLGTFTKTAATAGAVRFVFRGRVGKNKLAVGSYRLSAQLTNTAKQPSATVRRTFTIVRR